MSYKITYGKDKRGTDHTKHLQKGILAAIGIAILLIALNLSGLQGKIKTFLIPGDPAVTASAFENMVASLKDGQSLSNSVEAFCREIVENGKMD